MCADHVVQMALITVNGTAVGLPAVGLRALPHNQDTTYTGHLTIIVCQIKQGDSAADKQQQNGCQPPESIACSPRCSSLPLLVGIAGLEQAEEDAVHKGRCDVLL